jgi:hypothetical protein
MLSIDNINWPSNDALRVLNEYWKIICNQEMTLDNFINCKDFWIAVACKIIDIPSNGDIDKYAYVALIMRYTGQIDMDNIRISIFNKGKTNIPRINVKNGQLILNFNR